MARHYLNTPLTLEAQDWVSDGAGGRTANGWSALGILWAELDFRSGRRVARDTASAGRTAVNIILRAAPIGAAERPLPGQRLRDGARMFRILAVAEKDSSGRLLRCFCEEEQVA